METKIICNEDSDVVFQEIAQNIGRELMKLSAEQDDVTFAVCGGRSVTAIFEHLQTENIDWEKVQIFMVDERMVPLDHEDANYGLIQEHLIEPLLAEDKISKDQVHPFEYKNDKEDSGLAEYIEELQDFRVSLDLVLLSSGEDGHIAALYPEHHSIRNNSQFFIEMDDSPKMPPHRMTASRKLILSAQVGFLLFMGESKREAFNAFLNTDIPFEKCPAKLVNYLPRSYVGTDLKLE